MSSYHGWTHAPKSQGGTDPIPNNPGPIISFRAYRTTNVTVATNTETIINWEVWENEDSSVFGEELVSGGSDLQTITFKQEGVYTISGSAHWTAAFSADHGFLVLDTSLTSVNYLDYPNMGQYASPTEVYQFTYPLVFSATRKYPFFGIAPGDVNPGSLGAVLAKVVQHSGSDKTVDFAWLEIFYHGSSPG